MKYLVILLVLIGIAIFVPYSFANCISLPCDDDNIKLEEPTYRFIDFSYHNEFGKPITFILEKTAKNQCNSYFAEIIDENAKVVWTQRMISSCITSTDPELQTSQIKLGFKPHNQITLTDYGKYFLKIQIDDKTIETEFLVRPKTGVSFDRTIDPTSNPDPLDLWNYADVIIDGTIIEVEYTNSDKGNNVASYHIKANKYFKGVHEMGLVFAQNDLDVSEFDVNDNGLFYLKTEDTGYSVQAHSVKTFGNCSARDLIEISPVLPNEGFPRSAPTRSESYFDTCVADYFSYDPDFFYGIHNGISPLKQVQHGIPDEMIRCYDDLILIHKYDGSPACVTESTKQKLIERDWADRIMNDFCFGEYLPVCGEDNVTYGNQCYLEREHVELKYLGECENFIPSDYNLDETEFLQIKNNMENVGYHICDIQLDENMILIELNWIFEGSEPEKMILSNIPSNVRYEIKYLDGYADYFISKDSVYSCGD